MTSRMESIPALDGMRAIAVLVVMIAHAGFNKIVPGGFGVTIFFFLSGYLITTLMRVENDSTGQVSLRDFYLRRLFRIVPPLYVTLLLSAFLVHSGIYPKIGLFGDYSHVELAGALSQFFFIQNYAHFWGDPTALPITGVWSLAVEEHFYLAFPLLYVLVLRHLPGRSQAAVCLALCAAVLAIRVYSAETLPDFSTNYVFTHTRIDSILFGSCLAVANNPALDRDPWRPSGWHALAALVFLAGVIVVRDDYFRETYRYTLQGIGLYVLFGYAISNRGWVHAALASAPARLVARYSYTLYLIHVLLIGQMLRWLPWWPAVAVAMVLSFVYAAAMYRWIEKPLGDLRRRLRHGRQLAVPAQ
jgi:peptidoglycan/LPS O-acetylase OafA/YrhL